MVEVPKIVNGNEAFEIVNLFVVVFREIVYPETRLLNAVINDDAL
jgi:hypothetical protein